ncbi:inositol-trisphosphate 3-kinase A-like isoform X2 [Bolinopsis microptera]|uniref:inositol-trisphosphate 3-kinase A-like isoform X2 n=1 Tax=Bolinopsis microptera TaxID=2820187 RepID=UPI00307AC1A9
MLRDQGTVAEDSSLLDDSSSDPDQQQVVQPVAISFSYKPPKAISFSYRPPQLASSSTVPAITNSNHVTVNSEPPKTNAVPAKRNSELSQTNAGYPETNSKHPKTTNSEPSQSNSSHDDVPPEFSSPDEMEVFDGDSTVKDEFQVVDGESQDGPKLIEHTTDPKLLERFLRRGRTDSVCRLITNIYDSDESGWSSDEGNSAPRIGMPIRSLGPRKGRSSSSSDLMVQSRPRVIPPGPHHRRSTTDILAKPARRSASRSWGLIKQVVHWSPFVQVYKKKYPWVQLAGHNGAFKPCDNGTILKKLTEKEYVCLNKILDDTFMLQITPKFYGKVEKEGVDYVKLQDLLAEFDNPSVCDIKMGTRTYLEEELIKAREKLTMRKDMYEKMVKVDKNEPTEEEHTFKAVTKPRYMQWRERLSSTATLGFRIDGIKQADRDPDKNFKTVRTNQEVAYVLRKHIDYRDETRLKLLERLKEIRSTLEKSKFFASHEVIGSSVLLVHDQPSEGVAKANVWMIDFGKTTPLNGDKALDHRTPWVEGNQEDGYLFGLDNLVNLFENLSNIPAPEGLEDDQPAVG